MDVEWDTQESTRNAHTRGFDFAFARLVFQGPCLVREDRRRDYGERRMIAVGRVEGVHLTVVYTDRITQDGRTLRRIMSARRSNRRERQAHAEDRRG